MRNVGAMTRSPRRRALVVALALVAAACGSGTGSESDPPPPAADNDDDRDTGNDHDNDRDTGNDNAADTGSDTDNVAYEYPPAPTPGRGPNPEAFEAFERLVVDLSIGGYTTLAFDEMVAAGDARHAWVVSDLLRVLQGSPDRDRLMLAFETLTGVDPDDDPSFRRSPWKRSTDHLIAWDLPAPDEYPEMKAALLTLIDDRWAPLFDDPDAEIDWRWLNWGGVLIDDRPLGATEPCPRSCIPALDDPALVTHDEGGDWYPDDAIVFGIVEGDDAVALPRNVMEVHEMVNMTIGDRRFGIPYCTLCGSAHAYRTDAVPDGVEPPVLRTSGLLSRSNKVMFDLETWSLFDTFTGRAVSGPLREADLVLEQATLVVTTWGAWRDEHPGTRIVAEDGGVGRTYELDPLGGRDDDGPIFPVGSVDDRLDVHERVLGVIAADGTPVAFPVVDARLALAGDAAVERAGVELFDDAGGLRARLDGDEVAAHEAFWFAWSQFHPDTELWAPDP